MTSGSLQSISTSVGSDPTGPQTHPCAGAHKFGGQIYWRRLTPHKEKRSRVQN